MKTNKPPVGMTKFSLKSTSRRTVAFLVRVGCDCLACKQLRANQAETTEARG